MGMIIFYFFNVGCLFLHFILFFVRFLPISRAFSPAFRSLPLYIPNNIL